MIKSIILIIAWALMLFISYKFVRRNIDKVEKDENRYF